MAATPLLLRTTVGGRADRVRWQGERAIWQESQKRTVIHSPHICRPGGESRPIAGEVARITVQEIKGGFQQLLELLPREGDELLLKFRADCE